MDLFDSDLDPSTGDDSDAEADESLRQFRWESRERPGYASPSNPWSRLCHALIEDRVPGSLVNYVFVFLSEVPASMLPALAFDWYPEDESIGFAWMRGKWARDFAGSMFLEAGTDRLRLNFVDWNRREAAVTRALHGPGDGHRIHSYHQYSETAWLRAHFYSQPQYVVLAHMNELDRVYVENYHA
jgi:hypothetical protein